MKNVSRHQHDKNLYSRISVLVMLVSRNVFHVVSALQSLSLFHIFSADQISCRSYVGSVYRVRSLAVCVTQLLATPFPGTETLGTRLSY